MDWYLVFGIIVYGLKSILTSYVLPFMFHVSHFTPHVSRLTFFHTFTQPTIAQIQIEGNCKQQINEKDSANNRSNLWYR